MQAIIPQTDQAGAAREDVSALYVEHADRIQAVIAAGLRPVDAGDAEDLAQDVWLKFWEHVTNGNPVTSPMGLLVTMARRRVVDHYRSARVRRETARDMDQFAAAEAVAA